MTADKARCGHNPRPDAWPNIRGCALAPGHVGAHNLVDAWVLVDYGFDGVDVLGVFTDRSEADAAAARINARRLCDDQYSGVVVEVVVLDGPVTDDEVWFRVHLGDDGTIWVDYLGDFHENHHAPLEEIRRAGPDAPGYIGPPARRPSRYRPAPPGAELWERSILNVPDGVSYWIVPVAVPYPTEGVPALDARRAAVNAAVEAARRALAAHLEETNG